MSVSARGDCVTVPDQGTDGSGAPARFGRRALLTAGGAGALALLLPVRSGGHKSLVSLADSVSRASSRVRFPARLRIPKVLTGSEIHINGGQHV